jgi:N-acetylglucosaminyldiphosphoundecaprenol N-acetyl-beta-D-mannosaminyltransferase
MAIKIADANGLTRLQYMANTENIPRANLLGVGMHAVNMSQAVSLIENALDGDGKNYICATGVHGITEAQKDAGLKAILNGALLNVPDGKATVWIGWIQRFSQMGHVGGPELMLEMCRLSLSKNYTHFLYGGNPGVVEELSVALRRMFPRIRIVGSYTPPFRHLNSQEESDLIRMVALCSPDIFWVGISTPKQEKFMAEYLPKLDTKLMVSVGAAFDFHSGRVKFAPLWVRRAGFAWLYRLCHEPRRLWKRYLLGYPPFIWAMTLQLLGRRICPLEGRDEARHDPARVKMSELS